MDIQQGHGKSYISCGTIYNLFEQNKIDKILVICKPEGVENYRLELLRFLEGLITEDEIGVVTTDNREIEDAFNFKIIITNYITFRLTSQYYNKKVNKSEAKKPTKKAINFTKFGTSRMIILDEAQELNHHDSQQSNFMHLYGDDFKYRILMSGSFGYKFEHYYSLGKFLLPNAIPYSYSEWTDYVANKGTKISKYMIKDFKPERVKEFKEKIIDTLQISYKNCIPLPGRIDKKTYIAMSPKMRKIYQEFITTTVKEMSKEKGENLTGRNLFNKFPYLTQMTSDPILLKDKFNYDWEFEDSPKLPILDSLLEKYIKEEGRKLIIWGCHPIILNLLATYFKKYAPTLIHGDEKTSVKLKDRIPLVEEFKKNKKKNLLICSYVLATSLNITQATRQIYFDIPVDNDKFNQSKRRIDRHGQEEIVINHYLMYSNSIDTYIWDNILRPKEACKNTLASKDDDLTLEDFKEVFAKK
jgi:hypothetical protein